MITAIIPTFNRGYTLKIILKNVFLQSEINEVILVDDCGSDDTKIVFQEFSDRNLNVKCIYLRNEINSGAAFSRMRGVRESTNEFILFCDDDDLLQDNYTSQCLPYLQSGSADIITGRHFYRDAGEVLTDAISRYRKTLVRGRILNLSNLSLRNNVQIDKCVSLPFSHGILLTTRSLLSQFSLDPEYSKGNGYREETDFQVRAYLNGKTILMIDSTHAVGLNRSEVKSGGQRVGRLSRFYWTIVYNRYFYNKYFDDLKMKLDLSYSRFTADLIFVSYEFYRFFIRPFGILALKVFMRGEK